MKIKNYRFRLSTFLWIVIISASFHAMASGWQISNEIYTDNPFTKINTKVNKLTSKAYLVVGGDRAYNNAAFAYETGIHITEIINFDIDPLVLSFVKALKREILSSHSPEILYYQALAIPSVTWNEYLRRRIAAVLLDPTSIYNNQPLFEYSKILAALPLTSFELDINRKKSWQALTHYLKTDNIKIAVIDISNMLEGYVSHKQMLNFYDSIQGHTDDNTLVLQTFFKGMKYNVGHNRTEVYKLSDLYPTTRSNL